MGCSGTSKKRANYKSCVRYYNNAKQTLTTNATNQMQILGARVVDTGVSIETQPSSYTIVTKGLYHISGDVYINATASGVVQFVAYMDGVALPCTGVKQTIFVGENAVHIETDLEIDGCCAVNKTITFNVITDTTAAGTVEHICTGITKIA